MPTVADSADIVTSSPCEIVLELLRATDTEYPFAFVLDEQSYVRHLEGGAGRCASFPWSEEVLEHLAAVQRERADPTAAAWLAEEMRVFLGKLGWALDEESIRKALDDGHPVHLTLRLGAAELYALPWELVPLGATGRPLGSLPGLLLRYEWPDTRTARPDPDPPPEGGRILFAWSAAGGVVPANEHLAAIRRACQDGRHPDFDRARDVVPHASLGRLREALQAGPVAVLHLLCHGAQLDESGASYGLVFDADDRAGQEIVDARALQVALADHLGSLRLVVLSACHGGDPGALDSRLGSVAQALHRAGVPAVVASRYPLAADASVVLAEELYRALLVQARSLADAFLVTRDRLRERANRAGWASLQMYARAADGPDLRPIVHRPYRGLLAFQEEHARYFFGREAEVTEAIGDLSALIAKKDAGKPRFLICTGASGTGKSSLVLAGVVPALRVRDRRWIVAMMRPHDGWRASLQAAFMSRSDQDAPLLLVVDQFEELFTMIAAPAEREAFVRELWALASHPSSGVSVLATLRVDFLARCGEIQLWSGERFLEDMAYDEAHRVFVRRMKPEHLRKIIEWPAKRTGLSLEEGLCEQMLKDAGDEPGALPLLEYTLDQMWQQRRGRLLTWDQYNDLGGVGGALEKKADAILAGFDEVRQQAARRLLVQLVSLDGDARLDRRRRVALDKLRRGSPLEAAVFGEVLDTLARERLLVMSEGEQAGDSAVVEVAHEQLIRSWGALRAWVREDRQMLAELQKLDRWVEEANGFPKYVLDDDRLGHARDILARYAVDVGEAARELILRSERAARRKRRVALGTAIGASVAAVVMGVLAVWAIGQKEVAEAAQIGEKSAKEVAQQREVEAKQQAELAKKAEDGAKKQAEWAMDATKEALDQTRLAQGAERNAKEQATRAENATVQANNQATRAYNASLVASARELLAQHDVTAASKLLAEVREPDKTEGWVQTALDVLSHGVPRITLRGHRSRVNAASFSHDGKRIVTASGDGTVRVWSAEGIGNPEVLRCPKISSNDVNGGEFKMATFSPDGTRIVAVSDQRACVWNADGSGEAIDIRHANYLRTAAFSHDGKTIVTSSSDTTARISRADGYGSPVIFNLHDGVNSAGFSGNSKRIVTASGAVGVQIWNVDDPKKPIRTICADPDRGYFAAFSPTDSQRIVTVCSDNAHIWNIADFDEPIPLSDYTFGGVFPTFSPNGEHIVATSKDNKVRIWSAKVSSEPIVLAGHEGSVHSVAWSSDSKRIVTASRDGTARVWGKLTFSPRPLLIVQEHGHPLSAAWSPDGERIVTASDDATAHVWNLERYSDAVRLEGSPFGITKASLGTNHFDSVEVWSIYGHSFTPDHHIPGTAAAFSPDGKQIVTGGSVDGKVSVRSADGSIIRDLGEHERFDMVAFSDDGKRVVTVSRHGNARVWSIDGSGTPLYTLELGRDVFAVALDTDGKRIATGYSSGAVQITNVDNPNSSVKLGEHGAANSNNAVVSIAFSPDGTRVVSASYDRTARIWKLDGSGKSIVCRGHEGPVWFAAWSLDGNRVVTASEDHTARVWSAQGSSVPIVLSHHPDQVKFAAFSPDGKRVVTVDIHEVLRSWPISGDHLQPILREATTDCLSTEMRQTYLREPYDVARAGYVACEQEHHRTPLP